MEKTKLPNATAVLVLGILSIIGCCCYGVLGLVLGIVALVIAKKDMVAYRLNPELYSNYSALNTGRILAIIGVAMSAITVVVYIIMIATYGMAGLQEMNEQMVRDLQNR
ncbi:MAG: DUF4190 domain-containing protein [Proteobacteria bacterium]|nr:MAG: DUF4190 domain-containing protein [Pseudomonadota bacterium]